MTGTARSPALRPDRIRGAEVVLRTTAFEADLAFFIGALGFRLDRIWPADAPAAAALSGHGTAVRLERGPGAPAVLRLRVRGPAAVASATGELVAPGGHRITLEDAEPPLRVPPATREFAVCRRSDGGGFGVGRAGLEYRDLLPCRLGGAIIASHIRIRDDGPVEDLVHFHRVRFQLIFCHRGRVRLVYEDQGPPFWLGAGDAVIQPPEIRHRVLEAAEGLEVVEIGVPAEHLTTMDHRMELPTPHRRPDRDFAGTRFLLHRAAEARWVAWSVPGFEARRTGIGAATGGIADVRIVRRVPGPPPSAARHEAEIRFGFVRSGSAVLAADGHPEEAVRSSEAFSWPPGLRLAFRDPSDDFEMLEVTLPAALPTELA